MSAAVESRMEVEGALKEVKPVWVKNPEEPESFIRCPQHRLQRFGSIITPDVLVRDHFSIFKCVVDKSQSQSKSKSKSKSTSQPSIHVLTSTGNHSSLLLCAEHFKHENKGDQPSHTKAFFTFRPWDPSDDKWCENFERISNTVSVVQLAYGTFIEVFDKYFVTGTFTPSQIKKLIKVLNHSIMAGRGIFTDNIKTLLAMMRIKKDKQGGHFLKSDDMKKYMQYIEFITDVLRIDLLERVGSSLPIGSLATCTFDVNDRYPTRNDGGEVTDSFQKAAYNTFIIINVTAADGTIYSIHMDIKSKAVDGVRMEKISFWNGKLIEYTTTYGFIGQLIDKLETAPAFQGVDERDLIALVEEIKKIRSSRPKFGSNTATATAITTNCQFPTLFYCKKRDDGSIDDVVFKDIPQINKSYESIVGFTPPSGEETRLGKTGYYMLCPEFQVPFTSNTCNNIQFFTNRPDKMKEWFHFPRYNDDESNRAIGFEVGNQLDNSMERQPSSSSQPQLLSSSTSASPSSSASSSTSSTSLALQSAPAPAPAPVSVSVSVPRADPDPAAAAAAGRDEKDGRDSGDLVKQPSFFRSIFDTVFSYFFPPIPQISSRDFYENVIELLIKENVNELLIKDAMELADELDACTTDQKDAVLVHAVKHAYDTVLELNQMFGGGGDIYNQFVQKMIRVATAAADAAPGAAPGAAADVDPGAAGAARAALENLVHVSAFAVRVVACVFECKISREPVPECVKSVDAIFGNFNIDTPVTITAELLDNIREINSAIGSLKRKDYHGGRPRSRRRSRKRQLRTLKKKNISRKPKYSRRSRRSRRSSYSRKNSRRRQ
jgi:hypothetical protein